jgi:hypothetical protein
MALKPLTPGYLPLGQYDLLDSFAANFVGGEVGIFAADPGSDYYAADAGGSSVSPDTKVRGGSATSGRFFGLVDEGTAGYGTYYGSVIGGTVGQGTGFASGVASSSASGVVVVGPRTSFGSGKATLWTMPGLYGVTADTFLSTTGTDLPSAIHDPVYGKANSGSNTDAGKLTKDSTGNGQQVAVFLNTVADASLVSTSAAAATGSAATTEYYAVYLMGPR